MNFFHINYWNIFKSFLFQNDMFFKSPSSWVSFGQPPSLKVALSPTLPFLVRGPLSSWRLPSWGWAKLAWWWDDANKAIVLFFLCDSWCFAPLFCWSFLRGLWRPPGAAFAHGYLTSRASQVALGVKTSPANAEDVRNKGPRPRLGRSPGAGAWQLTPVFLPGESHGQWATVHGLAKSQTLLKRLSMHARIWLTAVLWEGMEAAILVTSLWLILPKVSGRCFSSSSAQITSVHWVLPHLSFPFSLPLLGIGFPGSSVGKESAFNARDLGLIPGLGRSPGEGKGSDNSMGCIHHEVIKSWTWLSDFHPLG